MDCAFDSINTTFAKQGQPGINSLLACLSPFREIPDEDAKKPEGWLDEEPAEIDDPGEWPAQAQHT